ncbi:MAG: hypothetical protein NTW74_16350 [Acidobacteria bacterium]|nr:hypothetical protein [Acidobacteriota bacterium]
MSIEPKSSQPLRRALVIWAFLLAVFFNPILPPLFASESTMSCCRKNARHACCNRYNKARVPVFQAQPGCGKVCCQKALLPLSLEFAILAPSTLSTPMIQSAQILIAGTGQALARPLPDSLFQRPPPVILSL